MIKKKLSATCKKMTDGTINYKGNSTTVVSVKGEYATYQVIVSFLEERDVANFMTKLDTIEFNEDVTPLLKDSILHINSKLLIGHFDLIIDDKKPAVVFSISQPFVREMNIDSRHLSKIVDIMSDTLDTFYQCFEAIQKGEINNVQAIDLWAIEPQCEA